VVVSVCRAQLRSSAQLFEQRRLPLLYVYSNSDEDVDSRLSAEFAAIFGADADSTDVYDEDCRPTDRCRKSGRF